MGEGAIRQRLLVVVAEVDYAICELDGEGGTFHSPDEDGLPG